MSEKQGRRQSEEEEAEEGHLVFMVAFSMRRRRSRRRNHLIHRPTHFETTETWSMLKVLVLHSSSFSIS